MGVIDDVLKSLDRIPIWSRLQRTPAEIDDLAKRVADLEAKLNGKWAGDVCRYCGARAAFLDSPPRGKTERFKCGECGKIDFRTVT